MKKINLTTLIVLTLGLLTSCLPQEKTTQCGADEAYNATQRRCVASVSKDTNSISIANVTPTNSYSVSLSDPSRSHAITVSDPYSLGYTLRWNVTYPSGTTLLVATGSTYTFNHSTFAVGSYVLEVQVLDITGSDILDSRSWTVNVMSQATPSISTTTPTPFSTTISSLPTTISTTVSNADLIANVNYQWYVNGSPVAGESGSFSTASQALSFNFNPQSSASYHAGAGVYSVQLSLTENGTGTLYSTYVWSVSNNIPGFTTVSTGFANTGTAIGNATPNQSSIVTVLDEMDILAGGFKNDLNGDGTLDDIDFCVQAADVAGVDGNGVFVDFLENGVAIPNGVGIQLTTDNTSFCLGDAISAAAATYSMDIPVLLETESRTVTAVVYDGFSGASTYPTYNGATELTRYTWTTRVRQLNTAPSIEIDSLNTNFPSGTCATSSTTSMGGCEITQDEQFQIAITVTDDDYDPRDWITEYQYFRVQFYLDGVLLDGSHSLSTDDCFHDFSEVANSTRYICTMDVNPYDTNGPIDPTVATSYTLTAVVEDSQSPYVVSGSPASNTVTWTITTVNADIDTGASINAFDETAAVAPTATESFVSEQSTPGTAIDLNTNANILAPQVAEGDNIIFNVAIDDIERDSHFIKIFRCDDKTSSCTSPVNVATLDVTSTSDANPKRSAITVNISEDAVIDNDIDFVHYMVVVRKDSSVSSPDLDTAHFYLAVENNNPDPVFNTANFNPPLNTIGTPLLAYSGVPITIDPGTITDASLTDGELISYQWMIAIDSDQDGDTTDETYSPIDGATSKNLTWTPGSEVDFAIQTGTAITLKLCIGDSGWDNTLDIEKSPMNATNDDCLNATLDSGMWFINAFSNMQLGQTYEIDTTNNVSNGQVAVWVDQSSTNPVVKYFAYVTINHDIVVEKVVTLTTGGKGGSTEQTSEEISSLVIPASSDVTYSSSTNVVTDLSIAGDSVNKNLYISYMTPESGVDKIHIRRIDISPGKTNASLLHDGVFGWDTGYDDLLDNSIPGAGLTEAIDGQGRLVLTVTSDANTTPTMDFTLNNLNDGAGSSTLTAGTDFCNPVSVCSNIDDTVTNLAAAIDDTLAEEFQGIRAIADTVADTVTLVGVMDGDYLQTDLGATSLGKIMVNQTSGRWELPFIDNDQFGANKSKISIYSGDLNTHLTNSSPTRVLINTTVQAQEVTNAIYKSNKDNNVGTTEGNDRILIVTRALGTGNITVHEFDAAYTPLDITTDLFGESSIYDVKVAIGQNTTNNSAYVIGRNASNAIAYARIDHVGGDFDFSTITLSVDLDNDFELIENNNATYFDIAAGPQANQLFMASVDSANNDAYLLSITGSLPSIDCSFDKDQDVSKCMKIQSTTSDAIFDLPIALGDVFEGVTLSDAGATALENEVSILPIVFQKDDGVGASDPDADALPVLGILNVSESGHSANNTSPGINYNIPYVND